jgi:signal transduction histidine kinase
VAELEFDESTAPVPVHLGLTSPDILPTVAHALTQPLTSALGCAATLRIVPEDARDQRDALVEAIERNLKQLSSLLGNLKAFGMIDSGPLKMEPETIYLKELLTSFLEDFCSDALAQRVQLICPTHLTATVDPMFFRQVLFNLVSNAKKFSDRDGVIRIQVEHSQGTVLFSIFNEGEGFPEGWEHRIFGRSVRFKSRNGLGLGLYISRVIVEANGGRIWAHSIPGHGATFFLTLPP